MHGVTMEIFHEKCSDKCMRCFCWYVITVNSKRCKTYGSCCLDNCLGDCGGVMTYHGANNRTVHEAKAQKIVLCS